MLAAGARQVPISPRSRAERFWQVGAWVLVGCLVTAGGVKAWLVATSSYLLVPVDGETLMTWLVAIAAALAFAFAVRAGIRIGERGLVGWSTLLLVSVTALVLPVGLVIVFIHGPTTCTVLTLPNGSRDWAVCKFLPLTMQPWYSLHRGNGFVYDSTFRNDLPGAPVLDQRGASGGDRYRIDEAADGSFVLRLATQSGGPINNSVILPR